MGLVGGQELLAEVLQNYAHLLSAIICHHVLQVHLPGSLTHDLRHMSTPVPCMYVFSHDGVPAV